MAKRGRATEPSPEAPKGPEDKVTVNLRMRLKTREAIKRNAKPQHRTHHQQILWLIDEWLRSINQEEFCTGLGSDGSDGPDD